VIYLYLDRFRLWLAGWRGGAETVRSFDPRT